MLRYHIAKYEETDPQIAAKLAMSFYVDDLVCGAHDIEGCRKLYSSAKEHMKKAVFNLRRCKTSDHTLGKELDNNENLPEGNFVSATEETYAKETLGSEAGSGKTKVLGLLWDMENDNLEFDFAKVTVLDAKTKVTKITTLSTIAKPFDSLGLVSPMIVGLKILFQKLCTVKIRWDEEKVTTEQKVTFQKHNSDLLEVNKISLPRCLYNKQADTITSCSLHGFGDIFILVISEMKWKGRENFLSEGYRVFFSGQGTIRKNSVAFICNKKIYKSVLGYIPISDRIISLRLQGNPVNITLVKIYAPTLDAEDDEIDEFYNMLKKVTDSISNSDVKIIMGDWNAKVGSYNISKITGQW